MKNIGVVQFDKPDRIGIDVTNVDTMVDKFRMLPGIEGFEIVEWPLQSSDPELTYQGKPSLWRMRSSIITHWLCAN